MAGEREGSQVRREPGKYGMLGWAETRALRGLDHLEAHEDRKQGNDLTDVHFQRGT